MLLLSHYLEMWGRGPLPRCIIGSQKMPRANTSRLGVGRVDVNYPKPGRLDIYQKRDGHIGATFLSEIDAGRYGVTVGVLTAFEGVGTFYGWAYTDENRASVFRFLCEQESNAPDCLLSIRTPDGRVGFPMRVREPDVEYERDQWVAFYARLVRSEVGGRTRRVATHVFSLGVDRFAVVARVVAAGRLTFPECTEILTMFFEGLPAHSRCDPRNTSLINMALDRAANDPEIPSQYRTLARVERSRGCVSATATDRAVSRKTSDHGGGRRGGARLAGAAKAVKNGIVTDVICPDLRLAEEGDDGNSV
jgi:hypothetical protein